MLLHILCIIYVAFEYFFYLFFLIRGQAEKGHFARLVPPHHKKNLFIKYLLYNADLECLKLNSFKSHSNGLNLCILFYSICNVEPDQNYTRICSCCLDAYAWLLTIHFKCQRLKIVNCYYILFFFSHIHPLFIFIKSFFSSFTTYFMYILFWNMMFAIKLNFQLNPWKVWGL